MRIPSWLALLMLIVLVGCGERAQVPTQPNLLSAETARPLSASRGGAISGRLLFARAGEIWLWQGSEGRRLIGGNVSQPAWSPDGEMIAYVQRGPSFSDVMLADATGAALRPLTNNGSSLPPTSLERVHATTWVFYPTWAPDRVSLVVAGQQAPPLPGDPAVEHNLALYRLDAAGLGRKLLHSEAEAQCGRVAFAPDTSGLVFARTSVQSDGQQQIYWLDSEADAATPFPATPTPSYDPAFSHDGRWLAFAAHSAAGTDIFVLPGDRAAPGAQPQRLTEVGSARAPLFSADGRQLLFLALTPGGAGFDLWLSDLSQGDDGALRASPPRQISNGLAIDADAGLSWVP